MASLTLKASTTKFPNYEESRVRFTDGRGRENLDLETEYRAFLEESLARPEGADSERSVLVAFALTLLARAQLFQKQLAPASASLAEAEAVLKKCGECPISLKVLWLIARGKLHIAERTPSQARILFAEAWSLAIPANEEDSAVEISQLMAAIEPAKEQEAWISRAIDIAKTAKSDVPRRRLAALHRALGWKRHELRRLEQALESFREADRVAREMSDRQESFLAQWAEGKTFRTQGRVEESLKHQLALLEKLDSEGERNGRLYEEIAECLQALQRPAEAQTYFQLAYHELSADPRVADNEPSALKRMKELGKVKNSQ